MSIRSAAKHVAVVPVAGVDEGTDRALAYAGALAPQVLAVYLPGAAAGTNDFAEQWATHVPTVPLIVLDGVPGQPLGQVVNVLRRTRDADDVTVVLPPKDARPASEDTSATWALGLVGPGVDVQVTPPRSLASD